MTTLTLWLRRLVWVLAVVGVLAYSAAAVVTVADILGRRIGLPIDGVVDLVQLFVVAGAWLVMPFAFMTGAHVGVDFVVNALSRRARRTLNLISAVVAFVLVALMLWQGVATFVVRAAYGDKSQQLGIPISWFWYPLLIGLAAALVGVVLGLQTVWRAGHENE